MSADPVEVRPERPLAVTFTYTNHRGEVAQRRVAPWALEWRSTEWHPAQWIMVGWDLDKEAMRYFAMADITNWRTVP